MEVKEQLQKKHRKLFNALITLEEALNNMRKVEKIARSYNEYPENIYKIFRDSLIQRFEYTFDLAWKFLADYLESEGRKLELKTPKSIFRECLKSGILTEDEVRTAIKMVDHRNLTTHGYDEELIEAISEAIPSYYSLLYKINQIIPL